VAVPPYILKQICRHGSRDQRECALDTLAVDAGLRLARAERPPRPRVRAQTPTPGRPNRTIRDAKGTQRLDDAEVVRAEGGDATGDVAADEAYDGLGTVYDFWWQTFQRDSLDGAGLPLVGVVHYGIRYDNAFWDGERMVFGDGDGEIFNRFTISLDIIGHELAHGVIEDEGPLRYSNQSGALNESLADVFGVLVTQWQRGQDADGADWLIGAGLFTDQVNGRGLRSMIEPGTAYDDPILGRDPQPAHFDDFVRTAADNGGVHINSGIPNRAFALAARAIGGPAWEVAGPIWFDALRSPGLTANATFVDFARETLTAASASESSTAADAVEEAWATVGVEP
jgi:Zn-dependent metalloprotease